MGTAVSPAIAARKRNLTPKDLIYQKYGSKASYKVEEVHEPTKNGCPGLAIPQKSTCSYRCILELPELSVVTGAFKKKKEAEQSAAEMAIEKLGIQSRTTDLTAKEAWDEIVTRLKYLFSDEFLSSLHPLGGHFRACLEREGNNQCSIPVAAIAIYDAKLCSLSKFIDPRADSYLLLVISFIMRAAASLSSSLATSEGKLWIQRRNPYPSDVVQSAIQQSDSTEGTSIEAILIPCSLDKPVEKVTLDLSSGSYYLDAIAKNLGLSDAANVFISRPIGQASSPIQKKSKASSETRIYFEAPDALIFDTPFEFSPAKDLLNFRLSFNTRASYLSGQDIHGDAVLASIGYRWNFKELFVENMTLQSYYRMLMSKTPSGIYKLSRDAIFAAELPSAFTSKTNWRGSFPRDILCIFCRQHQLSEPIISPVSVLKSSGSSREQKFEAANGFDVADNKSEVVGSVDVFRCEIRIYSKSKDVILECSPKDTYKKQNDAVQNVSLKVLSWLNAYFADVGVPLERLDLLAKAVSIQFDPKELQREFSFCKSVHYGLNSSDGETGLNKLNCMNLLLNMTEGDCSLTIEGPDSGVSPSNGSLSSIDYSVSLVTDDGETRELIETNTDFEFEMGSGAVIPSLEAIVSQMSMGQSAHFITDLPPRENVLAAAHDSARVISLLNSMACRVEYSVTLLGFKEPMEDRMEQALFSPPLSKQRVEFALHQIRESCATTLIDFGCGSGSLLESLISYQTSLQQIVGVDISQKSLARAAKTLHAKLSSQELGVPHNGIKSAVLYDGSITEYDPRLSSFDIGTCLEVIEHMEEDQASLFGNLVLSSFQPKVLVVSTPNYEYNVILQRSNLQNQDDDPAEKTQPQSYKFRNHDHKFEWTREQFNCWATELAVNHNYSVEFSGVGGSCNEEPGFASQIAVFRREFLPEGDAHLGLKTDLAYPCKVIWEWNSSNN